jgi:hypothetical protein
MAVMGGETNRIGAVAKRAPDDPAGPARVTVVNAEDALMAVFVVNDTMLAVKLMSGRVARNGQRRHESGARH